MINNSIHIIHTSIKFLLLNANKDHNNSVLETFISETNRLRHLLSLRYEQSQKTNRFKNELNINFNKLIHLSDELYIKQHHHSDAKHALPILNQLIAHIRERYVTLLDQMQQLPLYRQQELKAKLAQDLQPIHAQLTAKKINEAFIHQVLKALKDLFKDGRYPTCSYAQETYLSVFVPQLKLLAADRRTKDWERRLKQLVIKYNLNHMGVYKFLAQQAKSQLALIKDHVKVHRLIHELNLWLEQLQASTSLAYEPHTATLKELLLKELQLHQTYLLEQLNLSNQPNADKIALNTSVNELSLYFHYLYTEGVYNYKTKKEAASAICQHVQSKETKDISAHSLTKFDKLQLNNAAIKLYQRNKRIQQRLMTDFDL